MEASSSPPRSQWLLCLCLLPLESLPETLQLPKLHALSLCPSGSWLKVCLGYDPKPLPKMLQSDLPRLGAAFLSPITGFVISIQSETQKTCNSSQDCTARPTVLHALSIGPLDQMLQEFGTPARNLTGDEVPRGICVLLAGLDRSCVVGRLSRLLLKKSGLCRSWRHCGEESSLG